MKCPLVERQMGAQASMGVAARKRVRHRSEPSVSCYWVQLGLQAVPALPSLSIVRQFLARIVLPTGSQEQGFSVITGAGFHLGLQHSLTTKLRLLVPKFCLPLLLVLAAPLLPSSGRHHSLLLS